MTNPTPQFFQEVREEFYEKCSGEYFRGATGKADKQKIADFFISKFEAHLLGLKEQAENLKLRRGKDIAGFKWEPLHCDFNEGIEAVQSLLPLKK